MREKSLKVPLPLWVLSLALSLDCANPVKGMSQGSSSSPGETFTAHGRLGLWYHVLPADSFVGLWKSRAEPSAVMPFGQPPG